MAVPARFPKGGFAKAKGRAIHAESIVNLSHAVARFDGADLGLVPSERVLELLEREPRKLVG